MIVFLLFIFASSANNNTVTFLGGTEVQSFLNAVSGTGTDTIKSSPFTVNGTYYRSYDPTQFFPSITIVDVRNLRMLLNFSADGIFVLELTEMVIYDQPYILGVCQTMRGSVFNAVYGVFVTMLVENDVDINDPWAIALTLSSQVCAYIDALVTHDVNTLVNITKHEADVLFKLPLGCIVSPCK